MRVCVCACHQPVLLSLSVDLSMLVRGCLSKIGCLLVLLDGFAFSYTCLCCTSPPPTASPIPVRSHGSLALCLHLHTPPCASLARSRACVRALLFALHVPLCPSLPTRRVFWCFNHLLGTDLVLRLSPCRCGRPLTLCMRRDGGGRSRAHSRRGLAHTNQDSTTGPKGRTGKKGRVVSPPSTHTHEHRQCAYV